MGGIDQLLEIQAAVESRCHFTPTSNSTTLPVTLPVTLRHSTSLYLSLYLLLCVTLRHSTCHSTLLYVTLLSCNKYFLGWGWRIRLRGGPIVRNSGGGGSRCHSTYLTCHSTSLYYPTCHSTSLYYPTCHSTTLLYSILV